MPYAEVRDPPFGPDSFRRGDSSAIQAQAAQLLLIGAVLEGDSHRSYSARAFPSHPDDFMYQLLGDDPGQLRPLDSLLRDLLYGSRPVATRYDLVSLRAERRNGLHRPGQEAIFAELGTFAERMYASPAPSTVAELLAACLIDHPDELVRVAAASSSFALTTAPRLPLAILEHGTRSPEPLVRAVAATALARVAPDHPRLQQLLEVGMPLGGGEPTHTSMLVHGTWARGNSWWQPTGDFHTYLLTSLRPDLYSAADRFDWSGGYTDAARDIGGSDLRQWVVDRGLQGLDLFTHSHGGSVAMLASRMGLQLRRLILLSCPVHEHKYLPDFGRVGSAISVRVRMDLVLLADRSGAEFSNPGITEHILPVWFDHFCTHYPHVWEQHHIAGWL